MDTDLIWQRIDEQRLELAALIETLTPEQLATPSLCDAWTVRDVAVHLTHSHTSPARAMIAACRYGFRFNTMIRELALRDDTTAREAASKLRAMVGSRRHPIGTTPMAPLLDSLLHGQDIASRSDSTGRCRPTPRRRAPTTCGRRVSRSTHVAETRDDATWPPTATSRPGRARSSKRRSATSSCCSADGRTPPGLWRPQPDSASGQSVISGGCWSPRVRKYSSEPGKPRPASPAPGVTFGRIGSMTRSASSSSSMVENCET